MQKEDKDTPTPPQHAAYALLSAFKEARAAYLQRPEIQAVGARWQAEAQQAQTPDATQTQPSTHVQGKPSPS